MEIISTDKLKAVSGIQNQLLANATMNLLRLNKVNEIYDKCYHPDPTVFLKRIKESLNLQVDYNEELLSKIPKEGPFITVSNHPFGTIDGIILLDIIRSVRPDFKVMGNYLLTEIKPIADSIIEVDPISKNKSKNRKGIKETITHLNEGKPLGVFPSGQVSSWAGFGKGIQDKEWEKSVIKLIRKSRVPVIPIYFHGRNSWLFNGLGLIHPQLRTLQIPREALRKQDSIQVRIGKPIPVKRQDRLETLNEYRGFLRAKTYILGTDIKPKYFFQDQLPTVKQEAIASETPVELIIQDIIKIQTNHKLFTNGEFECFCAPVKYIPNVIREIGRLREVAFREVGEGSNKSIDIDHFDLHYKHLFIWDKVNLKIVGAYRIGNGKQIMTTHGKSGLYINSLFKISSELDPLLTASIELGRSFVTPEYQNSRKALFLLWRGVLAYAKTQQGIGYLIGPVSISNRYNKVSKLLIAQFITQHFYNEEIAQYIKPRKRVRFKYGRSKFDLTKLHSETLEDLDKVIDDIEPGPIKLPVLLKKYLKQKAKIVGFNLDPKFNNALDGFIVVNLGVLDTEFLQSYSES